MIFIKKLQKMLKLDLIPKIMNDNAIPLRGHPSRHEMSLRDLNQISIERDISETSQKHLKRDVFFVTSLRRLKNISKKIVFSETSLRRLGHILKKMYFL